MNDLEVVAYLRAHPDFLIRNPEPIEFLEVPHGCGEAISLIEYQAGALRRQSHDLRLRMRDLVAAARANETLGRQVHDLTLALFECHAIDEVLARVYQAMKDDFKVDMTALSLFSEPRLPGDRALSEFADRQGSHHELFAKSLRDGEPLCGRLPQAQAVALFAERAGSVGSGALLPLGGARLMGVLAICAHDPKRYYPGMGTIFLRRIAQVVTCAITPYLALE